MAAFGKALCIKRVDDRPLTGSTPDAFDAIMAALWPLSVRNLPGVHILTPDQLNTYDVLKSDDVVFSVEALNAYISTNTKPEDSTVEVSA